METVKLDALGSDSENSEEVSKVVHAVLGAIGKMPISPQEKVNIMHNIGASIMYNALWLIPSVDRIETAALMSFNFSLNLHEAIKKIESST